MSLFHGHNNRLVPVDSRNRISGTETNFTVNLMLPKNNWDRVALHSLSFPRAYYDVDSYTNQFTLLENGHSAVSVTIPVGNYNATQMASTLGTALTSASLNSWTYTVTYPSYSNSGPNISKFTFTVNGTGSGTNPPTISFTSQDLWIQAGFNSGSSNKFTIVTANSATLTSTNVVVISYINRIYLQSNTLCNKSQSNLLQPILIAGNYPSNSFIYWENLLPDVNSQEFTNNNDNVHSFQFFDQYGNLILNNGVDCNLVLLFYKKDDTSAMHYQSLGIQNLERLGDLDAGDEEADTDL